MAKQSRFTTRSRRAGKDEEVGWGPQNAAWENEIENAEGVDVVNGATRPSLANGVGSVAYYQFEQDLTDGWGGYHGSVTSGITYSTESKYGNYSVDSNGSDSEAYLGDFLTPGEFSFAFWMNADSVDVKARILSCDTFWTGTAGRYVGKDLYFTMANGARLLVGRPPTNEWIHVVGTYDSASGFQTFYVDGVEEAVNGNSGTDMNPGAIQLFGNDGKSVYNGQIDQLKFYDWELTQQEVSDLYSTGSV